MGTGLRSLYLRFCGSDDDGGVGGGGGGATLEVYGSTKSAHGEATGVYIEYTVYIPICMRMLCMINKRVYVL